MTEFALIRMPKADAVELLHILRHWYDVLPGSEAPPGEDERCVRMIGAICSALGEEAVSPWSDQDMERLGGG